MYYLVSNIKGGPNEDRRIFFIYHSPNSREGGQIFHLLHEKQGEGGIFSEINNQFILD